MSKKKLLFSSIMSLAIICSAPALAVTHTTVEPGQEHNCDAPSNGSHDVGHEGGDQCGNITDHSGTNTESGSCSQENTSANGTLTMAQFLNCDSTSGPLGGAGCSFTIYMRCGGSMRSGTVTAPKGADGKYPACIPVPGDSAGGVGIECTWEDGDGNVSTRVGGSCECYNGQTFLCH